ncbi:ABC transporter substrate-binding protein [Nocardia carnea]|uniref:ABC transporter substrate-binding protein n=1 Tax=Nocardia carnea TaxID=37328 RepID=UPI00245447DB|nr:extracellular solute-binding protein [Nocardia carnea]
MKLLFQATAAVAALAVTSVLTACGASPGTTAPVSGTWDEVIAAAESEGSVLLYSSQKPANLERLEKAFETAYPRIDLEFVRGTDADINPRVETENRTGRGTADVHMLTDATWISNAAQSGNYSTELVGPNVRAPEYRPESSVLENRFALSSAAVFALGWNTEAVPGGLASPRDILDPKYTGKIGIVNPTGIASYVDLYRYYADTYGADYWERMAELKPRIYPSALGIAQALTSGEIAVTPSVQPLVTEVAAGAPVDWALPPQPWGTPWYSHVVSVAPHPNAAQVLVDFLATREGQTALNDGYAAALPDIPGAVVQAQDIAAPDTRDLTPDKVAQYSQEWARRFQS